MPDYEPIDLTSLCNRPLSVVGSSEIRPGLQEFRGLPFEIARDTERCLIELDSDATVISLHNRVVYTVLFLHRLMSSDLLDGGPIGRPVAHYRFEFADGSQASRDIRERFEIALPRSWIRDHPALALPSLGHQLPSRFSGELSRAGRRPTGVVDNPSSFYIWAWRNPKPAIPLKAVVIEPTGVPFVIGAVTIGHVDESPLVPAAAQPVRIDLLDDSADRLFDIEVEVDRGLSSFAYPLPRESAGDFLSSAWAGFGEPSILGSTPSEGMGPYVRLQPNSPAYARIAAVPSATVSIRSDGAVRGQARWSDIVSGAVAEDAAVRIQLLEPGRNWVRTTVVDADTGRPIPCRVHFRTPAGVPYQPHGHHGELHVDFESWHADVGGDVRLGRISYAYIDGECEGWLPRGPVIVDVARGFEYQPLRTQLVVDSGQRELRLELKRWTDLNKRRWFSGDTHVHFTSTVGSHLEGSAEGLNVVNVLMTQAGDLFSGFEEFEGRPNLSERLGTIVYVGQENRQHFLGHLSLLGLKQTVMPVSTGGSTEAELGGSLETTLSHWADHCHAQGGTVVLPHLPVPNGEPAALIATGRVDSVEMCEHKMFFHHEYYRYLNAGYQLPLVGGTDKMSAEVPVGLYRTYVYIPPEEDFTYETWCEGMRRGRTFLSSGPIVDLRVDGRGIGSTLELPADGGEVEVEAWADSIFPIHRLELIQEGAVVADAVASQGTRRLEMHERVRVRNNTWFAVRVGAARYEEPMVFADAWARGVMAHTSPIYVACGGKWSMANRAGLEYMLTLTDLALSHVREMRMREPDGSVTHRHGLDDHQAYLEAPFLEATSALTKRIQSLK